MSAVANAAPAPEVLILQSRQTLSIPLNRLIVKGSPFLYPEIESHNYFSLHFRRSDLQISAGPFIGLIPINPNLTIDVRPRVTLSHLARMLDVANKQLRSVEGATRDYDLTKNQPISIVEFLCRSFLESLAAIELGGFAKQYQPVRRITSRPRGGIDIRRTQLLALTQGRSHQAVTRAFKHSVDIEANRILKSALWNFWHRLNKSQRLDRKLAAQLNVWLQRFSRVALQPATRRMNDPLARRSQDPSGQRDYYRRPLKIARIFLYGHGVSLVAGEPDIQLSSYVINFEELFEQYIRNALADVFAGDSGGLRILDGNTVASKKLFDDTKRHTAQPDIVVRDRERRNRLVVDTKLKTKVDRSDVEQVFAYCHSYKVRQGVLLYPATPGHFGRQHVGQIGDVALTAYFFDLDANDLLIEERSCAQALIEIVAAA